jgi:hypothetical protein
LEDLLAELRRIPDSVRLAQTVGMERQKLYQMRETRNAALEQLRQAQAQITVLEDKIRELEQIIITRLQGNK